MAGRLEGRVIAGSVGRSRHGRLEHYRGIGGSCAIGWGAFHIIRVAAGIGVLPSLWP